MKLCMGFAAALVLAGSAGAQSSGSNPLPGEFAILDKLPLFERLRGALETPPLPPVVAPPVFRGAIGGDGAMSALIETASGATLSLRVGDVVAWDGSRVIEVTFDWLRLANDSSTRQVRIGNDLLNRPAPVTPPLPDLSLWQTPPSGGIRTTAPAGRMATLRGAAPVGASGNTAVRTPTVRNRAAGTSDATMLRAIPPASRGTGPARGPATQ